MAGVALESPGDVWPRCGTVERGTDHPLLSSLLQAGLDLKDNLPPAAGAWPYPSVYHPYDAAFGYPFNG